MLACAKDMHVCDAMFGGHAFRGAWRLGKMTDHLESYMGTWGNGTGEFHSMHF